MDKCADACTSTSIEQPCGGTVLRCLTEKMEDITDAECKKEVFYFVKMEARCPSHWGSLGLKCWQGMPLQLVNSQLALEAVQSAASESWLALSGAPNRSTASVGTHSSGGKVATALEPPADTCWELRRSATSATT